MNVQEEINNILIDDKKDRLSSDKSVGESEWRGWFKRVSSSDRWQEEQERKMEEVFVYSYDKMLTILMTEDDMTERDAIDYIEYNVAGAWVGDLTPILVRSLDETEKFIIDKQTESVFNDKDIDDKEIN